MLGYFNDNTKNNEVIIDDPRVKFIKRRLYRTGDIAYFENGFIYLRGRIDGLTKIRGYRVHPDEISKVLDSFEEVNSSAVVTYGSSNQKILVSFIKINKGFIFNNINFKSMLTDKLPSYMIPNDFIEIDQFPLNQSGKIDKSLLKKRIDFFRK